MIEFIFLTLVLAAISALIWAFQVLAYLKAMNRTLQRIEQRLPSHPETAESYTAESVLTE